VGKTVPEFCGHRDIEISFTATVKANLFTNTVEQFSLPVFIRCDYSARLPAALALAQRARAAAAILALAAELKVRFPFGARFADPLAARTLAQRFFWAAAILARPAALMPDFLGRPGPREEVEPPRYLESSSWRAAIFSWMSAARRSCWADKFAIEFIAGNIKTPIKSSQAYFR
jgi:hypothetical protein